MLHYRFATNPKRVTRPFEEAVMVPSSSMVYSAEMLSWRKSPSGSFFCWAYHLPAYYKVQYTRSGHPVCFASALLMSKGLYNIKRHTTYSLGVKVVLDCKTVHNTGGRPAALNVGQENHQQGKLVVFHSEQCGRKAQVKQSDAKLISSLTISNSLFHYSLNCRLVNLMVQRAYTKTLDLTCLFCCCLERTKGRIQWCRISLCGSPQGCVVYTEQELFYTNSTDRLIDYFHFLWLNKVLKSMVNPVVEILTVIWLLGWTLPCLP